MPAATDSEPGRLLFLREGTLMAQPFDATRMALTGEAAPLAVRVGSFRDSGFFSASDNDVLVYRPANSDMHVGWYRPAGDCDPADHGTGRVRRGRAVA